MWPPVAEGDALKHQELRVCGGCSCFPLLTRRLGRRPLQLSAASAPPCGSCIKKNSSCTDEAGPIQFFMNPPKGSIERSSEGCSQLVTCMFVPVRHRSSEDWNEFRCNPELFSVKHSQASVLVPPSSSPGLSLL